MSTKEHLYWIDWMKVLGMYFIIAGHMFSAGNEYLYTFSVPLFFAISGFLCHHENDNRVFWNKLFSNLILPCLLICLIVLTLEIVARLATNKMVWSMIPMRLFNILIGNQGKGVVGGGIGMCWFIYTLVICKILYQYVCNKYFQATIVLLCIAIAIVYNENGNYLYNSIINVTLAYPAFIGGGILLRELEKKTIRHITVLVVMMLLSLLLIVVITHLNGSVKMYGALYGNNIFLFFIGAAAGIICIYAISLMLQRYRPKHLVTLSMGTVLILGFHNYFLIVYKVFLKSIRTTFMDYSVSLVILLAFIPIILLTNKYFPVLLGSRSKTT